VRLLLLLLTMLLLLLPLSLLAAVLWVLLRLARRAESSTCSILVLKSARDSEAERPSELLSMPLSMLLRRLLMALLSMLPMLLLSRLLVRATRCADSCRRLMSSRNDAATSLGVDWRGLLLPLLLLPPLLVARSFMRLLPELLPLCTARKEGRKNGAAVSRRGVNEVE
jgi:hypothetical protein